MMTLFPPRVTVPMAICPILFSPGGALKMIVAPVADAATLLPPILPPDPAEATTLEPASVVELARDASVVLLIFPVYDPSSSCLPLSLKGLNSFAGSLKASGAESLLSVRPACFSSHALCASLSIWLDSLW